MSYTNETVTNAIEFNAQNVLFAEPKVNPKTQGKSVAVLNLNKTGIKLSFPMALNWGAQSYTDPSSNRESYSMSIQFPGKDYATADTDKWLANMIALEESVLNHVLANWKKLFNKPAPSREVADALYTRSLKYQKDKETGETLKDRAPTMKVKLGYWEGKFDCELFQFFLMSHLNTNDLLHRLTNSHHQLHQWVTSLYYLGITHVSSNFINRVFESF